MNNNQVDLNSLPYFFLVTGGVITSLSGLFVYFLKKSEKGKKRKKHESK